LFERPDKVVDEDILRHHFDKEITAENFSALMAANYLIALVARDRKLNREYFEEVLVTTFNFQNRLVRISELNTMLEHLEAGKGFSSTEIREEVERHMEIALRHQAKLLLTLRLFDEMRGPEDPVS
jgi:hypothetical protein